MESRLVAAQATAADWKDRWEELNNFISPFRQDLAKYAEESQHLKHENRNKAMELKDLHNKIAGQMGHQNNRQKIHYLVSIAFLALVRSMISRTGINWTSSNKV